jgi:hypothetical protein
MEDTITLLRLEERPTMPRRAQLEMDQQHVKNVQEMSPLVRLCHLQFCRNCRDIAARRNVVRAILRGT